MQITDLIPILNALNDDGYSAGDASLTATNVSNVISHLSVMLLQQIQKSAKILVTYNNQRQIW